MNGVLKKSIALTVAMSMVNVSLLLVPAAYAVQPAPQEQTPYYQQQDQAAAGQAAPSPGNSYGAPAMPLRVGPTLDQMVIDGLILRPVMLIATVLGTGLFVVTLPASLLGGNAAQAGRKMVVEPAESTFATCLGCLMERNQSKYESWH